MKVVINYDLVNAIKDVKEPLGPPKVLRNEKEWYLTRMPLIFATDYAIFGNDINTIATTSLIFMFAIGSDLLTQKKIGYDTYAKIARQRLKKLTGQLKKINIDITYEMLLEAYMYDHAFRCQNDRSHFIVEEKYIMLPTYDYYRKERETSVLEEHIIGSDEYVLSVGTKTKDKKLVKSLA